MSNKGSVDSVKPKALVEHKCSLNEDICSLYEKEAYTDITFMVEGNSIRCHKVIMATRSEYFSSLLYGGLRESKVSEIVLSETSLLAFKALLRYIYTGEMSLETLEHSLLLEVLGLVHSYGFRKLETAICEYLMEIVDTTNVCMTYEKIRKFSLPGVSSKCLTVMDQNASDIISSEAFMSLSVPSLKEILRRNTFYTSEVEIFKAVCDWIQRNQCSETQDIWSYVRFSIMTLTEVLGVVSPSGHFGADAILDIIQKRELESKNVLLHRTSLIPEENVATQELQAKVLTGGTTSALLNGDNHNYNEQEGYTHHVIDSKNGQGIIVMLGKKYLINNIRLLLWDLDLRSYNYYLEVSLDRHTWERIIDHTKYPCRSWQNLYFEARPVKYVRIFGTHNTANNSFHVVSFECMYTGKPFLLVDGFLSPLHNIATDVYGAVVIVGRGNKALINGDTKSYTGKTGYSSHDIGGDTGIVVQLSQPYILGSMRILLWDLDDRYYSYYVCVSTDNRQWDEVVDRRNDLCQSWQLINFPPRPVVFIRIVGTANTAKNGFHCVHLECPAESGLVTIHRDSNTKPDPH